MHEAIHNYAIVQGELPALFRANNLEWHEALAARLVTMAASQIGKSVKGRGETTYSLTLANGAPNATRIKSVRHYFEKVVAKKVAEKM